MIEHFQGIIYTASRLGKSTALKLHMRHSYCLPIGKRLGTLIIFCVVPNIVTKG